MINGRWLFTDNSRENQSRYARGPREEIFDRSCIQSFDDEDLDSVLFQNDTDYGLQASVWTRNLKVAHMMARKIKAGTICINTHNYVTGMVWRIQTIRWGRRWAKK